MQRTGPALLLLLSLLVYGTGGQTQAECDNGTYNSSNQCVCQEGWIGLNCDMEGDPMNDEGSGGLDCQNGGFTFAPEDVCNCPDGYSGTQCEHDRCHPHGTYSEDDWVCLCNAGWTGEFCKHEDPCVHGYYELNDDICVCPPEYTGVHCESELDEEELADLCSNGGTYDPDPRDCSCPEGFRGRFCEFVYTARQCENGGVWANATQSCYCPSGYGGLYCEFRDPCFTFPCQNMGVCTATDEGFECTCTPGYAGARCQQSTCDKGKFSQVAAGFEQLYADCFVLSNQPNKSRLECLEYACSMDGNTVEYEEDALGNVMCTVLDCVEEDGVWSFIDAAPIQSRIFRQTESNPCKIVSCGQHGVCVVEQGPPDNLAGLTPACRCREGYTGTLCGQSVDACSGNEACGEGAACVNTEEEPFFACECPEGTYGVYCEESEPLFQYVINMRLPNEMFLDAYRDPESAESLALCADITEEFMRVTVYAALPWHYAALPWHYAALPWHRCEFRPGSVLVSLIFGLDVQLSTSDLDALVLALMDTTYGITSTPTYTSPVEQVNCGFENGFCMLLQDQTDDFDWRRGAGDTSTSGTGPETAFSGDRYAFIETTGKTAGMKAKLSISIPDNVDAVCLTMFYSMSGDDIGQLQVNQLIGNQATVLWREGGYDFPYGWQMMAVEIDASQGNKVNIVGSVGKGQYGDIAIDDVLLSTNLEDCKPWLIEGCDWNAMGPHSAECTAIMWALECRPDGEAVLDHSLDEYFSTMTLNSMANNIGNIGTRSAYGLEPELSQCLGPQYLRLAGGGGPPTMGRVEVFMRGSWGTVCDDDFDDVDAALICRQLGFIDGTARSDAYFGEGEGEIWLSGLGCTGQEASVLACPRNSFADCFHNEDASVLCIQDSTGPTDTLGWPTVPRSAVDYTQGSIFLLDPSRVVKRNGHVTSWVLYAVAAETVYLQIWRLKRIGFSGEVYVLIGQTEIMTADALVTTHALTEAEIIVVEEGDILGIYFPSYNPITYDSRSCYTTYERLRYAEDPPSITDAVGIELTFKTAELAWDPCRIYSIEAVIENDEVTTVAPVTDPPPTANPNAVYFCSFETDFCNSNPGAADAALRWTRTDRQTPTYGTGPSKANAGDFYIFMESSDVPQGSAAILTLPLMTGVPLVCLQFSYNMYGSGVGSLAVTLTDSEGTRLQMFESGTTGPEWIFRQETLSIGEEDTAVKFVGTVGSNSLGDIALDDIQIITGQCPVIVTTTTVAPITTSTIAPVTVSPELVAKTYTIMPESGEDVVGCGYIDNPCATVGFAVNGPEITKTIRIVNSSNTFDVSLTGHSNTKKLYIIASKGSWPTLRLTDVTNTPAALTHLNLTGVKVEGPIEVDCTGADFRLKLTDVNFTSDVSLNSIVARNCSMLLARLSNVHMQRPTVSLQAMTFSDIKISNSSFTSPIADVEVIASDSRRKRDVSVSSPDTGGILFDYPLKNSKHSLEIVNTIVSGLKRVRNVLAPIAALVVNVRKSQTDIKIRITNCNFAFNHRAIDFSLKGLPDIRIRHSVFSNNSAAGSGGAIRFSASLTAGFGTVPSVTKTKIYILNCTFTNNFANFTKFYIETDLYFQTRSPASGGAIFVFIVAPSQLHQDGLVSIINSTFSGNTAMAQGGTLFVNRDISTEIIHSTFANFEGLYRPKIGDIIQASCNMTMDSVNMLVRDTDSSAAVLSYQASDPSNSRLIVRNTSLICPTSHRLEELNTSSLAVVHGIESLQMYCRVCPEDQYSLNTTSVYMDDGEREVFNKVQCIKCPYGAKCTVGIQNNQGFWGVPGEGDRVIMYQCPQEYCEQDGTLTIGFDRCKENRVGTLCGHCAAGFSESMFNTDCISNEECGWKNWWVLVLIMSYGILYLLFFLFEKDYDNFQNIIREKLSVKKRSHAIAERAHNDLNLNDESKAPEEEVDVSKNGYFQIVMYFVQTAELLQVRMLMNGDWNRPNDLLPDLFIEWVGTVLSFDAFALNFGACLFVDIAPVLKTVIKIIYVVYIFGLLLLVYVLSGCCCFWIKPENRPKVTSEAGNNARILMTLISLFLYTYQSLAEYAFQLLNCVNVNGESVLFFDGNVECMQLWQYIIVGFVVIFVFPFFIVLLFGPKLLQDRDISLGLFFLSLCLPLFMAVPLVLWYFKFLKPPRKETNKGEYEGCAVFCRGEGKDISKEIVEQLSGVYRENLWGGMCWEGIMNLRRLVMVVLYSFITDMLIRQMMMSLACFVMLIIQIEVQPFYYDRSNRVEFFSLCTLLIMSGVNMVKAGYLQAQAFPHGNVYYILVLYEWAEMIFLAVLPLLLIVLLIVVLIVLVIRKLCCTTSPFDSSAGFQANTANRNHYRRQNEYMYNINNEYGWSPTTTMPFADGGGGGGGAVSNGYFGGRPRFPQQSPDMRLVQGRGSARPDSGADKDFLYDERPAESRTAYFHQRLPFQSGSIIWQNKVDGGVTDTFNNSAANVPPAYGQTKKRLPRVK